MSTGCKMDGWMDGFTLQKLCTLFLQVGTELKLEMCPGPHKEFQPKHRPSQVLLTLASSGSTAWVEGLFYKNLWGPGLSSMLGVKSKRSGGYPNMYLTWAVREAPSVPAPTPALSLLFSLRRLQGSGPHFTHSQLKRLPGPP